MQRVKTMLMIFQMGMKTIENWTTSCYILLAKNLSTFCPCSKILCEVEFKGDGVVDLGETF